MAEKILIAVDPDLEDLIPGFLDNRNKDLARLQQLLSERAFADIRLIGHSMKGVGGGYGFDAITEYGGHIEEAALAEDAALIDDYIARLAEYLGRIEVVFGQ